MRRGAKQSLLFDVDDDKYRTKSSNRLYLLLVIIVMAGLGLYFFFGRSSTPIRYSIPSESTVARKVESTSSKATAKTSKSSTQQKVAGTIAPVSPVPVITESPAKGLKSSLRKAFEEKKKKQAKETEEGVTDHPISPIRETADSAHLAKPPEETSKLGETGITEKLSSAVKIEPETGITEKLSSAVKIEPETSSPVVITKVLDTSAAEKPTTSGTAASEAPTTEKSLATSASATEKSTPTSVRATANPATEKATVEEQTSARATAGPGAAVSSAPASESASNWAMKGAEKAEAVPTGKAQAEAQSLRFPSSSARPSSGDTHPIRGADEAQALAEKPMSMVDIMLLRKHDPRLKGVAVSPAPSTMPPHLPTPAVFESSSNLLVPEVPVAPETTKLQVALEDQLVGRETPEERAAQRQKPTDSPAPSLQQERARQFQAERLALEKEMEKMKAEVVRQNRERLEELQKQAAQHQSTRPDASKGAKSLSDQMDELNRFRGEKHREHMEQRYEGARPNMENMLPSLPSVAPLPVFARERLQTTTASITEEEEEDPVPTVQFEELLHHKTTSSRPSIKPVLADDLRKEAMKRMQAQESELKKMKRFEAIELKEQRKALLEKNSEKKMEAFRVIEQAQNAAEKSVELRMKQAQANRQNVN